MKINYNINDHFKVCNITDSLRDCDTLMRSTTRLRATSHYQYCDISNLNMDSLVKTRQAVRSLSPKKHLIACKDIIRGNILYLALMADAGPNALELDFCSLGSRQFKQYIPACDVPTKYTFLHYCIYNFNRLYDINKILFYINVSNNISVKAFSAMSTYLQSANDSLTGYQSFNITYNQINNTSDDEYISCIMTVEVIEDE